MTKKPKYIIKDGGRHDYVPLEEIIRFEGAGSYVLIHVEGCEDAIKECGNLGDHAKRLKDYDCFVRIHNSHIVNVNYIAARDKLGSVTLEDGEKIPYSEPFEEALDEAMHCI